MRLSRWAVASSVTLLVALAAYGADEFPAAQYIAHVRYLASPELKGRGTGSPGLEKAAAYIVSQYKAFGVPALPGKGYEQPFTVKIHPRLGPGNSFSATAAGHVTALTAQQGFVPLGFSSTGSFSAPVVFAGYGITAADLHYDDYEGLDVKDKFVLVLRHEPQENDVSSVFSGKDLTTHAALASKATNAKLHGARGVILVNDVAAHPGEADALVKFDRETGPADAGVFFVQVKEATAASWFKAEAKNLAGIEGDIDKDLKPRSFPLNGLTVKLAVDITHESKTVNNVMAYLPGTTSEYVILGAHYDHLGLGDENSLAPSKIGQVHPGADDNASGTAGVLELARYFSQQPKHKRGIFFLNFAGEELGLLGSSWYVKNPELPLSDAVSMINMDMIGRIREGKVYVGGSGTGTTLGKLIDDTTVPEGLHLNLSEKTGYGASDHMSFNGKQVPVLFFFSGLHGDYHKPSDTWDKIDGASAAKLLEYVAALTTRLAADPARPEYQRVSEPSEHSTTSSAGSGGGYGPEFGSIPDFDEPPKGVRFADVRDGTPAAKAGLKAGDILIEFGGKEIGNLYDFTYALRAHKPGDVVLVKVLRGAQTIEAKVLLTARH